MSLLRTLIHTAHHCDRAVAGGDQAGVCDCVHLVAPLVQVYPQVKRHSHPLSQLAVVPDPPSLLQVEDNLCQHYLKYTPEHLHCNTTLYGPLTTPGTGFIGMQTMSESGASEEIRLTLT